MRQTKPKFHENLDVDPHTRTPPQRSHRDDITAINATHHTLITGSLQVRRWVFNSLAPGGSASDFKNPIFNLVLLIGIFRSYKMPQMYAMGLTDDKSTLV